MYKLETLNELTLKATCDGSGVLFTKAGAFIGGECYGAKNYQFEKQKQILQLFLVRHHVQAKKSYDNIQ